MIRVGSDGAWGGSIILSRQGLTCLNLLLGNVKDVCGDTSIFSNLILSCSLMFSTPKSINHSLTVRKQWFCHCRHTRPALLKVSEKFFWNQGNIFTETLGWYGMCSGLLSAINFPIFQGAVYTVESVDSDNMACMKSPICWSISDHDRSWQAVIISAYHWGGFFSDEFVLGLLKQQSFVEQSCQMLH